MYAYEPNGHPHAARQHNPRRPRGTWGRLSLLVRSWGQRGCLVVIFFSFFFSVKGRFNVFWWNVLFVVGYIRYVVLLVKFFVVDRCFILGCHSLTGISVKLCSLLIFFFVDSYFSQVVFLVKFFFVDMYFYLRYHSLIVISVKLRFLSRKIVDSYFSEIVFPVKIFFHDRYFSQVVFPVKFFFVDGLFFQSSSACLVQLIFAAIYPSIQPCSQPQKKKKKSH